MRPNILSIFLPQEGCPNTCVFCNQKAVTGIKSVPGLAEMRKQIKSFLKELSVSNKGNPEIAYYGGNFTGLPWSLQQSLLEVVQDVALETKQMLTIRISTRPDCIDEVTLERLKEYHVATIELGIQSLSDEVLTASGRGYTAETALDACRKVKQAGFQLGVHLMLGLPKDAKEKTRATLDAISAIKPSFIRIHPTLVLKDTPLATQYYAGEYQPLSLVEAIDWCKEMVNRCEQKQVPIARFGLQPSPELCEPGTIIAGPFHSAFGELVKSAVAFDRMNERLGKVLQHQKELKEITFYVPARELSVYRGQRNQNLIRLKELWNLDTFSIKSESKITAI